MTSKRVVLVRVTYLDALTDADLDAVRSKVEAEINADKLRRAERDAATKEKAANAPNAAVAATHTGSGTLPFAAPRGEHQSGTTDCN